MASGASSAGGPGKLEGHHKVGLNNGGSPYDPDNVETLCRDCHILAVDISHAPGMGALLETHIQTYKELTNHETQ